MIYANKVMRDRHH